MKTNTVARINPEIKSPIVVIADDPRDRACVHVYVSGYYFAHYGTRDHSTALHWTRRAITLHGRN